MHKFGLELRFTRRSEITTPSGVTDVYGTCHLMMMMIAIQGRYETITRTVVKDGIINFDQSTRIGSERFIAPATNYCYN